MAWDPRQYLRFEDARLRPALELLARVPVEEPRLVVDLGCGTGNLTAHLRRRWPGARVLGIDSSAEMLEQARADAGAEVRFEQADIATWEPDGPVDVLYSNAALHWLDDHDELFPRLWSWLAPGGALAVQMPRNHTAPTHTCAFEVARDRRWRDRLEPVLREEPVASPQTYAGLLADAALLDIWQTEYLQVLTGPQPVLEWTKGAMLRPLLAALPPEERPAFEAAYGACLDEAYPPLPDGRTLLPFRRLFVVAGRPGQAPPGGWQRARTGR